MKSKRTLAIAASALAAFASIVLITNQASASGTTSSVTPDVVSQTLPPVAPTADLAEIGNDATAGDNVQSGDQNTPDVAGSASETDEVADGTDGDNVQFESGDQTGPDTAEVPEAGSSN